MTKPLFPDRLNGIAEGDTTDAAQDVLRRLREQARMKETSKAAHGSPSGGTVISRSQPDDATIAGDPAELALEALSEHSGWRGHFPILAAIFVVSAIAGGTLAGLVLSGRNAPHAGPSEVRHAPMVTARARHETVVTPGSRPAKRPLMKTPATVAVIPAGSGRVSGGKDEARIPATPDAKSPKRPSSSSTPPANAALAPANGRAAAAAVIGGGDETTPTYANSAAAGTAKSAEATGETNARDALAALVHSAMKGDGAPPASESKSLSPAPKTSARETYGTAGEKRADPASDPKASMASDPSPAPALAQGDGAGDMKSLTDDVVRALSGLTAAGTEATPKQADDLRSALAALVDHALAEGRSQKDVTALLEKALEESGGGAMPDALRGANGKVDLKLLLASIIPSGAADRASNGDEQGYIDALKAEGARTTLNEKEAASRFYVRKGVRHTRIRRGDTLSSIAFEAYGDVLAYPLILRANAGRITSVRNLRPGLEIIIPPRDEAKNARGPIRLVNTPGKGRARAGTRGNRGKAARGKAARKTKPAQRKASRIKPRRKSKSVKNNAGSATSGESRKITTNFISRFTTPKADQKETAPQ